jgi:hypothetical protein
MHGPINVKSFNNTSKWQMGFNSAFKGLNQLNAVHIIVSYINWPTLFGNKLYCAPCDRSVSSELFDGRSQPDRSLFVRLVYMLPNLQEDGCMSYGQLLVETSDWVACFFVTSGFWGTELRWWSAQFHSLNSAISWGFLYAAYWVFIHTKGMNALLWTTWWDSCVKVYGTHRQNCALRG